MSKTKEMLREREQAFENQYFAKEDQRLLDQIRDERAHLAEKQALAESTGISEEALLDKLIALGIGTGTWAALLLVPLIEVAWADAKTGALDEREVRAVLAAAEAQGARKGGAGYALIGRWLEKRPDPGLLEAWGEYIVTLCADMSPTERWALRDEIVGRVLKVAEAAGGILGTFGKVSADQKRMIAELQKAFEV
jgi:hypothetical protein